MQRKPSHGATTLSPGSIASFHNSYIERGMSNHTGRNYASDLKGLLNWSQLAEIPTTDFPLYGAKYLNEYRGKTSPKTTERRLTSFRAFGRWCGIEGCLVDYKAPKTLKGQPHPIPEGMDGLARMASIARSDEHRAIIGLCGYAGLRIAEALSVRLCDFDLHEMTVTVRGKGDKTREVPVSDKCYALIEPVLVAGMRDPKAPLIHLAESTARKAVTSMGKRAKLKRAISSHNLRATLATHLHDSGVNIRVIQMILGHANVATTEIYTGVAMKQMREAVNR